MTTLPANISVANARLPATYEAAKIALAECESIDECKDWADKAQALASYARQSEDQALEKLAFRIRARAIRRAGELLKTYNIQGARTDQPLADARQKSQGDAAKDAGLSEYQAKTAVRVANVPVDDFVAAVESDTPPTTSDLAAKGTKHREVPAGFRQATHLIGTVKRFAEFCDEHPPELVAGGIMETEIREVRALVTTIDHWLDRFVVNLKGAT